MRESTEKETYRALFKSRRKSMSEWEYQNSSHSICRQLGAFEITSFAKVIHTFWPVLTHREPDITSVLLDLANRGTRLFMPIVTSFTTERLNRPRMCHAEFSGVERLRVNRWGIAEPEAGEEVDADELDLVIAPALGVDRNGNRIGHGYGYYDQFLSGLNIPIVCPIFAACVVDSLPHGNNDIPVSWIVTETEVIDLTKM